MSLNQSPALTCAKNWFERKWLDAEVEAAGDADAVLVNGGDATAMHADDDDITDDAMQVNDDEIIDDAAMQVDDDEIIDGAAMQVDDEVNINDAAMPIDGDEIIAEDDGGTDGGTDAGDGELC